MTTHEGLVNRIQNLCELNKTKLKPLEEQLGLGNGAIKKWDNSSPSCERILKVANYFNVSVDWLLTGKEGDFFISDDKSELLNLYDRLPNYDKYEIIEVMKLKIRLSASHDLSSREYN